MTTICYRDGVLAADTAVFDRGTYCGQMVKIAAAPDGTIGGGAGAQADVSAMVEWLRGGMSGEPPTISDDDSEFIWVKPDGTMWWRGPRSKVTQVVADYLAIGSGFRLAMGAMAHGASARQAVEIACDLDNHTRRPIMELHRP